MRLDSCSKAFRSADQSFSPSSAGDVMNNNFLPGIFFNASPEFLAAIEVAMNAVQRKVGIFAGDNLFTFNRNLGFLEDRPLIDACRKNNETPAEHAALWRRAVLVWAARSVLRGAGVPGDFVECGCYKGIGARIVADTVNFGATGRRYYLYDLFEHVSGIGHRKLEEHSNELYAKTVARFTDLPCVTVTQGRVPDVLHRISPERIAFLHIDLNSRDAEIGALEILFDRVSPGGMVVFDDCGWYDYRDQMLAEDAWLAKRGYHVLELPTGQGLLVK